ncbi:MAG: hypothetical protein DIZ78_11155 [endosymbiont of Escarpia spicata]|uniref:Uncharacterized protein n=1 Tax=endosymbiont of Escarpia spicata TaxID=2200908 RepID=A0A370DKS0_9GAMM|nr:MAG: hypothetical protein DIZ78_11155 [endosymbiont of Escarpia spicata]
MRQFVNQTIGYGYIAKVKESLISADSLMQEGEFLDVPVEMMLFKEWGGRDFFHQAETIGDSWAVGSGFKCHRSLLGVCAGHGR